MKKRRIDHHVVEMLAANIRMIHDQHVAGLKAVSAMHAHAVDDGRAEIGQENRQRAEILRQNIAFRIDDADAVVAHLVDHHVVGSLAQHGGHLVGDMGQAVAHDFDGDRVDKRMNITRLRFPKARRRQGRKKRFFNFALRAFAEDIPSDYFFSSAMTARDAEWIGTVASRNE